MGNSCEQCKQLSSQEKTRETSVPSLKKISSSGNFPNKITLKGDPTNPKNNPFKSSISSINFEISKKSSLNLNYSLNNPFKFSKNSSGHIQAYEYSQKALITLKKVDNLQKELPSEIIEYAPDEVLDPSKSVLGAYKVILSEKTNSTYQGEISDLSFERQGIGEEILNSGAGYFGEWRSGKKSGFGIMILETGECYIGEFDNDFAQGFGLFYNPKLKIKYIGEFKENVQEGKGKEIYLEENSFYEGQWEKNLKHGLGKYWFGKGESYYEGEWVEGEMTGKGKFVYEDGSYYEGEVDKGLKHGEGILVFEGGEVYEGEWKGGKIEGKGKLQW